MARSLAATIGNTTPDREEPTGFRPEDIPDGFINVTNVLDGMVTSIPRGEVPPGSFEKIFRGRVREDWVGTRPGTTTFSEVAKPDSEAIDHIVVALDNKGDTVIARLTDDTTYLYIDGAWVDTGFSLQIKTYVIDRDPDDWLLFVEYDPINSYETFSQDANDWWLADGTAYPDEYVLLDTTVEDWLFLLVDNNRGVDAFDTTQMFDSVFFSGGGAELVRIDLDNSEVEYIAGSPIARYVTTFGDRVIAANIVESGTEFPNRVAWSANADPYTWSGLSSGQENLVQGARGFGDHITGIFGLELVCLVLRRNSIWHMTRQPFATAPFKFQQIVGGVGCDLPFTAKTNGTVLFFADRRSRGVYAYEPGSRPQRISLQIDSDLRDDLEDPAWVGGGWDPFEEEYYLGIKSGGSGSAYTKLWVFSLRTGAWTQDLIPGLSSFSSMAGIVDYVDQLTFGPAHFFLGTTTGEILEFDDDLATDWDGTDLILELISPNFGGLPNRRSVKDVLLDLEFSNDALCSMQVANKIGDWRHEKQEVVNANTDQWGLRRQVVTGSDLYWRFRAWNSRIKLRSWWARVTEKRMQR